MSKLFRLFPFLLLISGICFFPIKGVLADGENDTDKKEIDISISPSDTLFDINNMKPGDWAPRTITVKNSGRKDFAYQMQVKNSGEKKLFNELWLEIKAADEELYQGKIAAFKSLSARKLTSSAGEDLDITIRFPEHLGNEFQGLKAAFVITFTVESVGSGTSEVVTTGEVGSSGSTPSGIRPPAEPSVPVPPAPSPSTPDMSPPPGASPPPGVSAPLGASPSPGASAQPDESPSPGVSVPTAATASPSMSTQPVISSSPSESVLPATSTQLFNLLLLGSLLVVGGMVLMIIRHYRQRKMVR